MEISVSPIDEQRHLFLDVLEHMKQELGAEIESAEGSIRESFRYRCAHRYSDIHCTLSRNLRAQFYRLSPQAARISRFMTCQVLCNCLDFYDFLTIERSELKVVSLGGGYGADVVGFCSAISEVLEYPLELTVVDEVRGWRKFLMKAVEAIRMVDFGLVNGMFQRLSINVGFIGKDLRFPNEYLNEYIQKADVVFMKSFLSIIHINDLFHVRQMVADNMATGSVLLLIDSPDSDFSEFGLKRIYQNDYGDVTYGLRYTHMNVNRLVGNSSAQLSVYVKPEAH